MSTLNWILRYLTEILPVIMILWPVYLMMGILEFRSWKRTGLYFLLALYLSALYHFVGLPDITYLRFDLSLNLIPFNGMLSDLKNTLLNILLFLPLGFLLPLLWKLMFSFKKTVLAGFTVSVLIEILQILTWRATDINDVIANTAGTLFGYLIAEHFFEVLQDTLTIQVQKRDCFINSSIVLIIMFFVYPFIHFG